MNRMQVKQSVDQPDNLIYTEELSSIRTEALFVALAILFLSLLIWRVSAAGLDAIAVVFTFFFALFVFYSVNYRRLVIHLAAKSLALKFGIFTWNMPIDNIARCTLDEVPLLLRMGGAGIHFMTVRGRYRASFNFLEYPRVVVAFKKKMGPAKDISFSTRRPEDLIRLVQAAVTASRAGKDGRSAGLPPTAPRGNGGIIRG